MTGKQLEVVDVPRQSVQLTNEQLTYIANTEFVPKDKRGNLPAILACVATGRAMGIDDMFALNNLHVIDGSVAKSAELVVYLVRRAGHSIQGEVKDGKAIVAGKRVDNGDEMTVEWTLEMAERAGLLKKRNWQQYTEAMLWARAVTQLSRMLFADCFAGQTYTPEELGEEEWDVVDAGSLVESDAARASHVSGSASESLTEPDDSKGRRAAGNAATPEPVSNPGLASGSVSDLVDLMNRAKQEGIPRERIGEVGRELFAGRSAKELNGAELEQLWNALHQEALNV